MGIQFEKLKKKSDRPTHTGKTGSGKGKQKFLRLALVYSMDTVMLMVMLNS